MTVGYFIAPFAEPNIVYSGSQSMYMHYDNNGTVNEGTYLERDGTLFYSEAQRSWETPQDWTRRGVKTLTLWFYGDAGNSAEPLYVAVQDSIGITGVETHPEPNVLQEARWHEWNIDLKEFNDEGVNLVGVKTMYIGVGNRAALQAGGTGDLYIDNIRLYRP
jgi:hypothetical protein